MQRAQRGEQLEGRATHVNVKDAEEGERNSLQAVQVQVRSSRHDRLMHQPPPLLVDDGDPLARQAVQQGPATRGCSVGIPAFIQQPLGVPPCPQMLVCRPCKLSWQACSSL